MPNTPRHVGFIMDGNGRWARQRSLPRTEGHRAGAERARQMVRVASEHGIEAITLYAFSKENWLRPKDEVSILMKLLETYLRREINSLIEEGIRFRAIGELSRLPQSIQELISQSQERSRHLTRMTVTAALSYGGRDEIIRAFKKALASGIKPDELTEEGFSKFLDTEGLPEPDLIIRTSGEMRISNFLTWQSAYSEFYFTDTLWPDFSPEEFVRAIEDFRRRERRFGGIPAGSAEDIGI